jgi:3-dehydroquinate synthase
VHPLHGEAAAAALVARGWSVTTHVVPAGEASKSWAELERGLARARAAGLERGDLVVALGGGVVGDLAGLVAALHLRGVAFVQCPTSLLAQVDASIGGKVAIDVPDGKNLLGTFHFPHAVLIDPHSLRTLPSRQLSAGLAEMLKHGALFDAAHFAELESSAAAVRAHDAQLTARLVRRSVALKAACVAADPFEVAPQGRNLLNLGHTLGHALETCSGFDLLHGEAVGLGLRAAARLSAALGLAAPTVEAAIVRALAAAGLPTDLDARLERHAAGELTGAMGRDKKRAGGTVTYIALEALGRPTTRALEPQRILDLLRPRAAPC